MAQRRMFSKEITNSSEFLMMSQSAQNLYFHFGMNSDDDWFCEVFTIMRMTDSKPDDLQALHARWFVYVVDWKVCIVKDWHENNQIRSDRYKQSKYLDDPKYKDIYLTLMEEKIREIWVYKNILDGVPIGNQMATQVRLGKDRLVKEKPTKKSITESKPLQSINIILNDSEMERTRWLDILQEFVNYWGETNSRWKEKRQLQKTRDLNKRLTTRKKNKETNFWKKPQTDYTNTDNFLKDIDYKYNDIKARFKSKFWEEEWLKQFFAKKKEANLLAFKKI